MALIRSDFFIRPAVIPNAVAIFLISCIFIEFLLFSDLLLNSCQKKQENQAAIFIRFSVDTANIPCNRFVNLAPLRVS